jgi:hypothetical protein
LRAFVFDKDFFRDFSNPCKNDKNSNFENDKSLSIQGY